MMYHHVIGIENTENQTICVHHKASIVDVLALPGGIDAVTPRHLAVVIALYMESIMEILPAVTVEILETTEADVVEDMIIVNEAPLVDAVGAPHLRIRRLLCRLPGQSILNGITTSAKEISKVCQAFADMKELTNTMQFSVARSLLAV